MATLYADVNNGVHLYGDDDFVTDIIDETTFYNSLSDLPSHKYIKCKNVSEEMMETIKNHYGIHN